MTETLLFLDIGAGEILIILAYPLLVIYCLIDIIRSTFKDSATKVIWALIVLCAPFLGSIAYLIAERNSKV